MSSDSGAGRRAAQGARRASVLTGIALGALVFGEAVSCTTTWAPVPPRFPEGAVRRSAPRAMMRPPVEPRSAPDAPLPEAAPEASSAREDVPPGREHPPPERRSPERPPGSGDPPAPALVERRTGEPADVEPAVARRDEPARATPARPPHAEPSRRGATARPSARLRQILQAIEGYQRWPRFPENDLPLKSVSHDGTWVVAHYNDVVGRVMRSSAPLPLPDGAILVNESRPTRDGAPSTLAIMSKQGGEWYWAKTTPEGRVVIEGGAPLEGPNVRSCEACHAAARANDHVFTHPFRAAP